MEAKLRGQRVSQDHLGVRPHRGVGVADVNSAPMPTAVSHIGALVATLVGEGGTVVLIKVVLRTALVASAKAFA